MADTLGEDRLLDEVERAVAKFGFTDAKNLDSDDDELGRTRIYNRDGWFTIPTSERYFVAAAPDWLARLCARVRHLEAEVEHEHSNATAILRKYEEAIADADRAEAASQRLTEALRMIAEYNVGANHGAVDEWTEAAAFHDCKKLAQATLRAGAPPEDAR